MDTADVVIIGAGIHGVSLAFHLAKRGVKPVVLERFFLASQATGHSNGLVRMHYDLELLSKLAWESFQYFSNWSEMVGGDCGFTRTGFLQIVSPIFEENLRANVVIHQRIGIPTQVVTAEDVYRLVPSFVVDDFNIAAYEPDSGYADPSSTTRTMMQAAQSYGARLVQECRVIGINAKGSKVTGVRTCLGDFSAPVVVNAAGAWAAQVGTMGGVNLPVNSWRHDSMYIRQPKEVWPYYPMVIDYLNSMYFRPETGRLTLVGLRDGNLLGESPDQSINYVREGFVERAIERICRRVPAMENSSLHSTQVGYDGITPDQRPILGQANLEGFYLCCGFSGSGFKIGPAVGACMAELILDGQAKTVDITPFSLNRFSEGKRLQGKHPYDGDFR